MTNKNNNFLSLKLNLVLNFETANKNIIKRGISMQSIAPSGTPLELQNYVRYSSSKWFFHFTGRFFNFLGNSKIRPFGKVGFTGMLGPQDPEKSMEQTTRPRAISISSHRIGSCAMSGNSPVQDFFGGHTRAKKLARSRACTWAQPPVLCRCDAVTPTQRALATQCLLVGSILGYLTSILLNFGDIFHTSRVPINTFKSPLWFCMIFASPCDPDSRCSKQAVMLCTWP